MIAKNGAAPVRLLLVEDEPANRALVRAIVARAATRGVADFELIEAEDLESARRILTAGRFRAVLLDVRLPDGSGLELLPALRDGADRPWIVVVSASVHIDEQVRAIGGGADLFMGKPIETAEFLEVLARIASSGAPAPTSRQSSPPASAPSVPSRKPWSSG